MSSITIHNLDERLNILLRKKAKEDGKSLNKNNSGSFTPEL